MNCDCGNPIEEARLGLGLKICRVCAFSNPVAKVRGAMIYEHKNAPSFHVESAAEHAERLRLDRKVFGNRLVLKRAR